MAQAEHLTHLATDIIGSGVCAQLQPVVELVQRHVLLYVFSKVDAVSMCTAVGEKLGGVKLHDLPHTKGTKR